MSYIHADVLKHDFNVESLNHRLNHLNHGLNNLNPRLNP